ncbi:MAG: hypothetical protein ACHQ7M_04225 [Chloroflexota bacterium]
MTPEEAQIASQSVVTIVQQALVDHLESLLRGDAARVRYDFADSVRERIPTLEVLVPSGLRRYELLSHSYDGHASHEVVRLEGDTNAELDWQWANVDGRFRIVDVRPT